jgi:hypothetical protein
VPVRLAELEESCDRSGGDVFQQRTAPAAVMSFVRAILQAAFSAASQARSRASPGSRSSHALARMPGRRPMERTWDVRLRSTDHWPDSSDEALNHVGVFQSYLEKFD